VLARANHWRVPDAVPRAGRPASGRRRAIPGGALGAGECPLGRRLHEEVQQRRLLAASGHEHVPARAEPRQQLLGRERRQHRPDRRVDRVTAFAQHPRTGRGRQRVPGGDDSLVSHAHSSEA